MIKALVQALRLTVRGETASEINAYCPSCDTPGNGDAHLYINSQTGLFDCKKGCTNGNPYALVAWVRFSKTADGLSKDDKRVVMGMLSDCGLRPPFQSGVEYPSRLTIQMLSKRLVVAPHVLRRLGAVEQGKAVAFPMRNARGEETGKRLRLLNGKPRTNPGGKLALMYPDNLKKSEPVICCEGESDAACALNRGLNAMALPGAGQLKKEDAEFFRDSTVYLVPDLDHAGQKGAEKVARMLWGVAKSVRVIRLPGEIKPKDGADLRDFLREKGVVPFRELIEKMREWKLPDSKPVGKPIPADLADEFLRISAYRAKEGSRLLSWQDDFYKFNSRNYQKLEKSELRAEIVKLLQNNPDYRAYATRYTANEVLTNCDAIVRISSDINPPSWLSDLSLDARHCISMANGIFDLDKWMEGKTPHLREHTSDFFCLVSLPYDFDPTAQCPKWLDFLEEMLPDESVRDLLQEWFGYNLIFDISQEKFCLFVGEGANGKTVCCVVLRELLGEASVCAVNLEQFHPNRTFPMAGTKGKLANIVQDMSEIERVEEGILKEFVSGNPIEVELKYRDAFTLVPTARLTFATNILPRFSDRSDGLWRRLLLIPFKGQILSEEKQDKKLINPRWWRDSGELPGVFNWALEGLQNLLEEGYFFEPEICRQAKEEFKTDSNPAGTFLSERVEWKPDAEVSTAEVYTEYSQWSKSSGHNALSIQRFAKEVRRAFPQVAATPNAIRQPGSARSKCWLGLVLLKNEPELKNSQPWYEL